MSFKTGNLKQVKRSLLCVC